MAVTSSMGNCVQSSSGCRHGGAEQGGEVGQTMQSIIQRREAAEVMEEDRRRGAPVPAPPPSVVKVKMVLTKGELGWLVARLKRAGDRRRLEDVLHEMVARKRREDGWRPSLESIVECPAEAAAGSDDS